MYRTLRKVNGIVRIHRGALIEKKETVYQKFLYEEMQRLIIKKEKKQNYVHSKK